MQNVSIVANGKTFNPAESGWSDDGAQTVSYLKYRAGDAGTYAIGVSTKPKVLTLPAPVVNQFVKVSYQGIMDTMPTAITSLHTSCAPTRTGAPDSSWTRKRLGTSR